jgi:hypothetical protein
MDAACVSSLGTSLVSFLADAPVAWLSYDMFNPTDTFGKMMRWEEGGCAVQSHDDKDTFLQGFAAFLFCVHMH